MNRVFISYARREEPFARRLAGRLRQERFEPWIDRDEIAVGASAGHAIRQGIDSAASGVLVIGSEPPSDWTRHEWSLLLDAYWRGDLKQLVPVLIGAAGPPGFLRDLTMVLAGEDAAEWDGACSRVVEMLRHPGAEELWEMAPSEELFSRWQRLEVEAKALEPSDEMLGIWREHVMQTLEDAQREPIRSDLDVAMLWQQVAGIDLRLGRYDDAQAALVEAKGQLGGGGAEETVELANVSYALGRVQMQQEDWHAAVVTLTDALRASEEAGTEALAAESAYSLALAHSRCGAESEASRMLRRASELADRIALTDDEMQAHRDALRGARR